MWKLSFSPRKRVRSTVSTRSQSPSVSLNCGWYCPFDSMNFVTCFHRFEKHSAHILSAHWAERQWSLGHPQIHCSRNVFSRQWFRPLDLMKLTVLTTTSMTCPIFFLFLNTLSQSNETELVLLLTITEDPSVVTPTIDDSFILYALRIWHTDSPCPLFIWLSMFSSSSPMSKSPEMV